MKANNMSIIFKFVSSEKTTEHLRNASIMCYKSESIAVSSHINQGITKVINILTVGF